MSLFRSHPATSWNPPDERLTEAIEEYLALSRSPLRTAEPTWFALAEQAEWERLCAAAEIAPAAGGRAERAGPGAAS